MNMTVIDYGCECARLSFIYDYKYEVNKIKYTNPHEIPPPPLPSLSLSAISRYLSQLFFSKILVFDTYNAYAPLGQEFIL